MIFRESNADCRKILGNVATYTSSVFAKFGFIIYGRHSTKVQHRWISSRNAGLGIQTIKGVSKMQKKSVGVDLSERIIELQNKIDVLMVNPEIDNQELYAACRDLDMLIEEYNKL